MTDSPENYLPIDPDLLTPEALNGLIEEFILREGTDYGHSDFTLSDKKKRVFSQLKAGHVKIVFSTATENTTLLPSSELRKKFKDLEL